MTTLFQQDVNTVLNHLKAGECEAEHVIYYTKLAHENVYRVLVWLEARGKAKMHCDRLHTHTLWRSV